MKKLILVRHAKSSWKHDVIDHERPLNKRGINDAIQVSNYLKNKISNIDLVLVSDAERTKKTAEIFTRTLNIDKSIIHFNTKLYDFTGYDLIDTIKSCDTSVNKLMIFGHNHAVTDFANNYGNIFIENIPTSSVVILKFDIQNWNELKKGITTSIITPKDLK